MTNPGTHWYVVQTQPHRENQAEVHLRRQGFTTYLPRYLRTRRHARRTETVIRPLFPRYLFVALDVARERWRSVHSTIGVSQLVVAGDDPLPIPNGIVEEIRAREDGDGYVALGLPAGVGIGSKVRLIDGIFADAKGVLDRIADDRRVAILLELLGREVRVFVSASSIRTA
jgi:transcriptional antiterminator RfaH